MAHLFPFSPAVESLIELALQEDLCCGDLTSDSLFDPAQRVSCWPKAKQDLVVAGLGVFQRVFERVDAQIDVELRATDGDAVSSGTLLAEVSGPIRSVLRAERTALNFLCRLSGVATLTAQFVAVAGPDGPRICDTRKTTPGFRELEKYAVRAGGGFNHRFNLGSSAMLKDNHIAAVGDLIGAVTRLRQQLPHTATIEVEVTNLDEVQAALKAGVEIVMLDNMGLSDMRKAVEMCAGRVVTEASGRVTLERIAELREVGVDVISSGALTHSAPTADISLEF